MTIQIYRVGGCVRDRLLREAGAEIPSGDRDWVVVGATPEKMLAAGFMPVGADFPVFLHPETHEEYALARTERKVARGYHGFTFCASPEVTLEEDLLRRDLTVNAMAEDKTGRIIDPYGGRRDLAAKVLRHVSAAFAEDPVRILRLARFAARLPDFRVAEETDALAARMVQNGETDALVPERIWKEFSRGFAERCPRRMLEVLEACGYWGRAFAGMALTETLLEELDRAARLPDHADVAAALVFSRAGDPESVRNRLQALRAPSDTMSLCELVARVSQEMLSAETPQDFAGLFAQADVLRRPERFEELLRVLGCMRPDFDAARVRRLAQAFCAVDAGAVAKQQKNPRDIPAAVQTARLQAVARAVQN